jgi:molecular chaperone DnaJ
MKFYDPNKKSMIRQAFDGSGGFMEAEADHAGMNMDDIFSQFGDFRQCLGGGGGSKVN